MLLVVEFILYDKFMKNVSEASSDNNLVRWFMGIIDATDEYSYEGR